LIGVHCSCSSASSEYKKISFALHAFSTYDSLNTDNDDDDDIVIMANRNLLKQLESFSLQLMATEVQFTAKGFFEITNRTLRDVKNMKNLQALGFGNGKFLFLLADSVSCDDLLCNYHSVYAQMEHF